LDEEARSKKPVARRFQACGLFKLLASGYGLLRLMLISELDYDLPPDRIATRPAEPRDHSRLMVVHRGTGQVEHRRFYDLPEYLLPSDLLVVNDTRVIPAKLELRKTTGAVVPGLFLAEKKIGQWEVMLRTRGKVKPGDELVNATGNYHFRIESRIPGEKGCWLVSVAPADAAPLILARIGGVPLPPYIEKSRTADPSDREAYQTVYAREGKSLAAPTAGLHFTPSLLAKIDAMGVKRVAVNLEVGLGTFLPVETHTLEEHPMHTEIFAVPAATVSAIRNQRQRHGRIIVIGTTAVRTLESAAKQIIHATPQSGVATCISDLRGSTNLKISPGFPFQLTDVLLTNFHLPRSTLMALVGALVGVEKLKQLYTLAIEKKYRFYSYGDAMLIV